MKKLTILTSVLALAACGGGSGGGGGSARTSNNPGASVTFGNATIPTAHITDDAKTSNGFVTGMDNSVTNVLEMTAAVETAIGEDNLNELANNLDNISSSNSNLTIRSASTRRPALRTLPGFNNKANAANYAMTFTDDFIKEMAHRTHDETLQFLGELSVFMRNIVFKMLCHFSGSCGMNYSLENLASMIQGQTTQHDWNDFYEQNHYREYTLENVDFTMAATSGEGGDESANFKDILSFELDPETGEIAKVHYKVYDRNGNEDEEHAAIFNRIDEKIFHIYQNAGHGSTYVADGEIITYGKNFGLKYSDFGEIATGQLGIDSEGHQTVITGYREPFAGGYKELRKETPETAMNFAGKAIGNVQYDGNAMNINGNASLEFASNGQETLAMNFSNPDENGTAWYDVTIVRNKSADTHSITFTTNDTLNANIHDDFKFNDFAGNTRTPTYNLVDGYNFEGWGHDHAEGIGYGKLDIGYYGGSDGNVTEATGVTQYVERPTNGEHDLRMTVSFGMSKEP